MWRMFGAVAALLAVGAAFFWIFGLDALWGVLAVVVIFVRRFMYRSGIRLFVLPFIMPWLPLTWRRAIMRVLKAINALMIKIWQRMIALWARSPWPMSIVLTLAIALLAGVTAVLLLVVPLNILSLQISALIRERLLPLLLNTAAAKSIESQIPPAWKKVPEKYRAPFTRPYKWLWYRTTRIAIRYKRVRGARGLEVEHRQLQLELEHRERLKSNADA